MQTSKRIIRGKHLSLASGLAPNTPDCAKQHLGKNVYHIKDFLHRGSDFAGKRIAVVGGGQSGAEAVHNVIANSGNLPSNLSWISRRDQFAPIDDSVFANEIFTPGFSEFFYSLSAERKEQIVQQQTLASDGISPALLEQIYQRLYFLECIEKRQRIVDFVPGHKLEQIESSGDSYKLVLSSGDASPAVIVEADIVILATGYRWQLPSYLGGLSDRIPLDENGHFLVNKDYSIEWDGPDQHRIYVQNGARHSHGVADPNLSLMAWRSATIINSIAESLVYDLDGESSAMDWQVLAPVQSNFSPPIQRASQPAIQLPFTKEGARLVSRV